MAQSMGEKKQQKQKQAPHLGKNVGRQKQPGQGQRKTLCDVVATHLGQMFIQWPGFQYELYAIRAD